MIRAIIVDDEARGRKTLEVLLNQHFPEIEVVGQGENVKRGLELIEKVEPPQEGQAAHALLISAAHLARNAAAIRGEAVRSGDLARARDASSAAAGALMLSARARTEIQSLLRPPQLK